MKDYQYHIFSPYRVCPLGIKGCPNVSSDMKSDIDFFITELQGQYNYFNVSMRPAADGMICSTMRINTMVNLAISGSGTSRN